MAWRCMLWGDGDQEVAREPMIVVGTPCLHLMFPLVMSKSKE